MLRCVALVCVRVFACVHVASIPFHRLRFATQHALGGVEFEAVGLAVRLHESHEPIPLFGRRHNVRGFDRLRLSVRKFSVDIVSGDLALLVDHKHTRDLALGRRAGVKYVRVVEEKGGNSAGAVLGACELDVGDDLFFESADELDGSVKLRSRNGGSRRGGNGCEGAGEGRGCDEKGGGEHGLHCESISIFDF